ncbi:peptidoglycan bridge formation glycyltransferase FemA/FemB family protein [Amylibacter sp.]|jgi:lipid II:glycine glycyltransferase (peptidoglycan interpeptide bridge formation enzyme)|nr:peptidoglycan bridge formation glycyltransferase FemA/FemB family protein [Amylibacter sp.]
MEKTSSPKYLYREISREEWKDHWSLINQSNLMQSWEYGDAKAEDGWRPIRYLFEGIDGKPVALAQLLVKTWPIFGGVGRLNRGPVLIEGDGGKADDYAKLALIKMLEKIARSKRCWILFLTPEMKMHKDSVMLLKSIGLTPQKNSKAWGSSLVSLDGDVVDLLKRLNGKWRNLLSKSQRNNLVVERVEYTEASISGLIEFYEKAQRDINFSGIPSSFLKSLWERSNEDFQFCQYFATELDSAEVIGVLVSVTHGDTATYLLGNTNSDGRKLNANYRMLWEAIIDAKNAGCLWFDLGGINKNTPKGVAHFKSGLNGDNYQLIGNTISFLIFK